MLDCLSNQKTDASLLAHVTQRQRREQGEGTERARRGLAMGSPQSPENTIDDGTHANVPAEHVKGNQDSTPSQLSREVGSHDAEQHHNNVQHDALHQYSPCMSVQT